MKVFGLTKVLYFRSNTIENLFNLYTALEDRFNGLEVISFDEVEDFLSDYDKYYIKELPYQFEVYNLASEYVFCINKPNIIRI